MPSRKSAHFIKWFVAFNGPDKLTHMSEKDCRSLKKLFGECPATVKVAEWEALFNRVNAVVKREDITIDAAHEDKGRKWIKEQIYKIRKSLDHQSDRDLFDKCNEVGIKRFYFGGYYDGTSDIGRRFRPNYKVVVPVWKVERNDGKRFSYAYGAWQGYDQVIVNPHSF